MKKMLIAVCSCALTLSLAVTPALAAESDTCPYQNGKAQPTQFVRNLNSGSNQTKGFNYQPLFLQLLNKNFSKTSNNCTFPTQEWGKVFFSNVISNCDTAKLCELLTCGFDNGFCDAPDCNFDGNDCADESCTPADNSTSEAPASSSEDASVEEVPASSSEAPIEEVPASSSESSSSETTTLDEDEVSTSAYREFQKRVIELVNEERAAYGLPALKENAELDKVATMKSEDMARLNYFSHTSPTYGSPFEMLTDLGINYTAAGENIAMGQPTPESVMDAWMNSEGHRANILNSNFTHIGVGIAKNSRGQYIWTQTFLRP
ncbi:MAG: CAP domain-containing protein [Bacteroidaceae bacterium]|nr:CAP domain-containing protein [Bacteroidaceae bacterium]